MPIQKFENLNRNLPSGIDAVAELGGREFPVRCMPGQLSYDFSHLRHSTP